jgi:uncharacterized protein (TIGR02246 family)
MRSLSRSGAITFVLLTASLIAPLRVARPDVPHQAAPDMGALWGAEWSAHHLDRVMTLYTSDAVFFTLDSRFKGLTSIRTLCRDALATYQPTIHMHRTAFGQSVDLAHESGEYDEILRSSGKERTTHGYYLMVLRKERGQWLIAEQMWTESKP